MTPKLVGKCLIQCLQDWFCPAVEPNLTEGRGIRLHRSLYQCHRCNPQYHRQVLINHEDTCLRRKTIDILVLVKNRVEDQEKRNAIRKTWKLEKRIGEIENEIEEGGGGEGVKEEGHGGRGGRAEKDDGRKMEVFFVVGISNSSHQNKAIQEENEIHKVRNIQVKIH